MQSLILAAGYATRLYPLTQNFPKPLLKIGSKTILDRLIADLDQLPEITQHNIVTNNTFFTHFNAWKNNASYQKEIIIINDQTTSNDNRLGAVKDILFTIEQLKINDDLLVLAGDNVLDFSFRNFISYAALKGSSCITCHHEPSLKALQKTGVLEADENFRVKAIHEKPLFPPSNWAVPPFYLYKKEDLPLIKTAIQHGCHPDAPGNLAAWLCKQTTSYAWQLPGKRYDIGDLESYKKVNEIFQEMENER